MRVESVENAGPESPAAAVIGGRRVTLTLSIEEPLKGIGTRRERVETMVEQYERPVMGPPVGVWTGIELVPGARLLVLAEGNIPDASRALAAPSLVLEADDATLASVRAVVDAERNETPLDRLADPGKLPIASLDWIFGEYVAARALEPAWCAEAAFEKLLALAASPELAISVRSSIVHPLATDLPTSRFTSLWHTRTFAKSLFGLLDSPLAANVAQTYLPNVLGLLTGKPSCKASEVFPDVAATRAAVAPKLQGLEGGQRILVWLRP